MRAVVVYESMFGNTREVAEAIGAGLEEHMDVAVLPVSAAGADVLQDAQLLVVGGPTHMHGLSTALSRRAAMAGAHEDGHTELDPDAGEEPGLRAWLAALLRSDGAAATFDTRLDRSGLLTGAAARGIARRLRRHGYTIVAEPQSYFVAESEGPLADGETARAHAWGAALAACIPPETSHAPTLTKPRT
jgi:Flavodoxin